jgi:hypothetical protein
MHNDVWDVVPRPKEKSVVSSKWIYKTKHTADGSVDCLFNQGVNSMCHEDMHQQMQICRRQFGSTGQFMPPTHFFVNEISAPLRGLIM